MHGDFSPKNILIRDDRMVLLDCEVAWYGDPVFDVAFFLNHLFLKSLHHAPRRCGGDEMVDAFWRAYAEERSAAEALEIEKRLVPLLLMLLTGPRGRQISGGISVRAKTRIHSRLCQQAFAFATQEPSGAARNLV